MAAQWGEAGSWQHREISTLQRMIDEVHFKWRETRQPMKQVCF